MENSLKIEDMTKRVEEIKTELANMSDATMQVEDDLHAAVAEAEQAEQELKAKREAQVVKEQ